MLIPAIDKNKDLWNGNYLSDLKDCPAEIGLGWTHVHFVRLYAEQDGHKGSQLFSQKCCVVFFQKVHNWAKQLKINYLEAYRASLEDLMQIICEMYCNYGISYL